MNLTNLSDQELHLNTIRSVENERRATYVVLFHLMEADRRRLYSKMECKNLHHYAEKELKYPGEQAYLRIAAMKLLKELPEIKDKVISGSLSLTHLTDAKRVFNKKDHSKTEKLELLNTISSLSTRKARKIIAAIAPEIKFTDKIRYISEDTLELQFIASINLEEKLIELKGRLAHKFPKITWGELFEMLVDKELKNLKEEKSGSKNSWRTENSPPANEHKAPSKAQTIRQVWMRDQYQCVNCSSTYALEIDHVIPKGKGGEDSIENMRVLCRNCNHRAAIEHYGIKKMATHLKAPEMRYG